MEINIYEDFLSLEEIIFLTGYKQPARQIKRLNKLGIPFIAPCGNTKYPVIRREFGNTIKKKYTAPQDDKPKERKRSAVLNRK